MLTDRIVYAAMLFTVTACATAVTPEQQAARDLAKAEAVFANDVRRGDEVDRVCFARSIDSFGETTKRAVVIREGSDHYLVETHGGCFDLDWAQSLVVDASTSCLTRGDRIHAFDSAFGPDKHDLRQPACLVNKIYDWNPDAESEAEETPSDAEDENLESAALD